MRSILNSGAKNTKGDSKSPNSIENQSAFEKRDGLAPGTIGSDAFETRESSESVFSKDRANAFLAANGIKTKLEIGGADDAIEQEADAAAESVMSGRRVAVRKVAAGAAATPQDGNSSGTIQKTETGTKKGGVTAGESQSRAIESALTGGSALSPDTRSYFESKFGTDFSGVTIHTDASAQTAAKSIGAKAFTKGNHIAFGAGQFKPGTPGGDRLLAHELAHVAQGGDGAIRRTTEDTDTGTFSSWFRNLVSSEENKESDTSFDKGDRWGWETIQSNFNSFFGRSTEDSSSWWSTDKNDNSIEGSYSETSNSNWWNGESETAKRFSDVESQVNREKTALAVQQAIAEKSKVLSVDIEQLDKKAKSLSQEEQKLNAKVARMRQKIKTELTSKLGREPSSAEEEAAQKGDSGYGRITRQLKDVTDKKAQTQNDRNAASELKQHLDNRKGSVNADNFEQVSKALEVDADKVFNKYGEKWSESTKRKFDLESGTFSRTKKESNTQYSGENEIVSEETRTSSVSIKDGMTFASGGESIYGENGETTGVGRTDHTKLIVKGDEYGFGKGHSTSVSINNTKLEKSVSGSLTNKGAAFDAGAGISTDGKRVQGSAKVGVNGSFVLDVKPVKDGTYKLVLTVSLGGKLDLSGGTSSKSKAQVGAAINAGASAVLTYEHMMDREEAARYVKELDNLQQNKQSGGKMPEFGVLERLNVLADLAMDGGAYDALSVVDGDAASGLKDGDSYELVLSANAGGSLNGSAGKDGGMKLGGNVGVGTEKVRHITVSKAKTESGQSVVRLTVGFKTKDELNYGASASSGGATFGANHAESTSSGRGFTWELFPDSLERNYNADYGRIVSVMSEGELSALANDNTFVPPMGKQISRGDSAANEGAWEMGGIKLGFNYGNEYNENISTEGGNLLAQIGATNTKGGALSVKGVKLLGDSTTVSATGTMDEHSASLELAQKDESTRLAMPSLKGFGSLAGVVEQGKAFIQSGPAQYLENQITQSLSSMEGVSMDEGVIMQLVHRATKYYSQDSKRNMRWDDAAGAPNSNWKALGRRLRNPVLDKDQKNVDPKRLVMLDHIRAVSRFIQQEGETGLGIIRNVLVHFGGSATTYVKEGSEENLGMWFEWPEELIKHKGDYDTVVGFHKSAKMKLDALTAGQKLSSEESQTLLKEIDSHMNTLNKVRRVVRTHNGFENLQAQFQMIENLDDIEADLDVGVAKLEYSLNPEISLDVEALNSGLALHKRKRVLNRLGEMKRQEKRLIAEAADEGDDVFVDEELIQKNGGRLFELHEHWITQIKELRALYREAQVSEQHWAVSTGPLAGGTTIRNPNYEPDPGIMYKLVLDNRQLGQYKEKVQARIDFHKKLLKNY